MVNPLRNHKLHFEELKGWANGLKKRINRQSKLKNHPFLKEQKLDKNWGKKLAKPVKKAKAKVSKPAKKRG